MAKGNPTFDPSSNRIKALGLGHDFRSGAAIGCPAESARIRISENRIKGTGLGEAGFARPVPAYEYQQTPA